MLFGFFLKRFYATFGALFFLLTFLLASSNFFVRFSTVPSLDSVLVVFWTMLPLMALFAMPIAICLAIQIPLGSLFIHNETLLFYLLSSIRTTLYKAVLFFTLTILFLYVPLIFEWSPQSYSIGKKQLIQLAKKQFSTLAPKMFHTPYPDCTVFFKNKTQAASETTLFDSLLLAFKNKTNGAYIFTANQACLHKDMLYLKNGTIYSQENKDHYRATFENAEINIGKLLEDHTDRSHHKKLKFLRWKDLLEEQAFDTHVFLEFHRRFAQIIWLLFLPFLALFCMFIFAREGKNNFILSFVSSGLFFLLMYLCTSVGQIFNDNTFIALSIFYVPPVLLFMICSYFYSKKL
ncbi:MAG: LptF/LptG family permease [bacterium]